MKHISWLAGATAAFVLGMAANPARATEWSFKLLYGFCAVAGCADGDGPHGGLVVDASGNLYGTTAAGGTLFEVTRGGKEIVLHGFTGAAPDGYGPMAGLVADRAGTLYGTTYQGGTYGVGTVFERPKDGVVRTVVSLQLGRYPEAGVIPDAAGNLFGTTNDGGANGVGTVFEVTRKGEEETLYSFCAQTGCADGKYPEAGLIMDASGDLYGTASAGGTVFELVRGR